MWVQGRNWRWLATAGCLALATQPIGGFADESERRSIQWRTSYAEAADEAAEKSKPILIEITAVWCSACKQMEQLTFKDRQVAQYVDSAYVPLIIDADKHSDLVSAFHITAYPTTLVVSPELKIAKRFTGYQSASTLLPELERIVQKQFASMDEIMPVSAIRPVNTTPFAFEGFCLVSILEDSKLRRGTPEFVTTYKDQQICFHTEGHLKKFQENPEKYWPVANGKCLVSEREEQQESMGDPRVGVTWRGRLWLFSDREHQQRFIRSPRKYMSGKI